MRRAFKRAYADIRANKFLHLITIVTIALSILVVSTFMLFFENMSRVVSSWKQGGRVMAYLDKDFTVDMLPGLNSRIKELDRTKQVFFISKDVALDNLKEDVNASSSFLDTLEGNPLPHSMDIRLNAVENFSQVRDFVEKLRKINHVTEVEYGQKWLGKFMNVYKLFKFAGYAMSSLFFLIALFITANTVRLAFFSRKEEIEIMRLVGATEGFIKHPFYLEGVIQGAAGGLAGILILSVTYLGLSSGISSSLSSYMFVDIRFLSVKYILTILVASTCLGWVGCYISLKQLIR
jgi:cell division transport system permease protein